MADLSPYTPATITDDDKLWAALMYAIPLVGIGTLLFAKGKLESQYIHFHAIQVTALAVPVVASLFLVGVCTLSIGILFLGPASFLLNLFLAYKAYQGEVFELPVITDQLASRGYLDSVKRLPPGA